MRLIFAVLFTAACVAAADPLPLTLTEALAIADKQNPAVAEARLRAAAAAEVPKQVRSALYPLVNSAITGVGSPANTFLGAGALSNSSINSRFAGGFTASQLITDFGRTSLSASSANLLAEALREGARDTAALLRLRVIQTYEGGLRGEALLRSANETVAERQLIVDRTSALAESKLRSELDVSFAKVNLADAQLLVLQAANQRRVADAELAQALGLDPSQQFVLTDDAAPPPADSPRPPFLLERQLQLQSAQQQLEYEKRSSLPTVSAFGATGIVPVGSHQFVNLGYGAAGVNVTIPVLNGGLFSSRRRQAELNIESARERLRDTELTLSRSAAVAGIELTTFAQRVRLAEQLLEQARLSLELAQTRYDLGLSSIVELSQAQLAATNAEIQTITSRYDLRVQEAVANYYAGR